MTTAFWQDLPKSFRAILGLLAFVAAGFGFFRILGTLTPFIAAFAVAYFLNPSLNAFEKRVAGWIGRFPWLGKHMSPRGIGVLLTLGSLALIVVAVLLVGLPALTGQVSDAVDSMPRMAQNVRNKVAPLLERLNMRYPDEAMEIRAVLEREVRERIPQLLAPVTRVLRFALESTLGFVLSLINFLVVPVFAGYLLHDMNQIRRGLVGFIPPRVRPWWLDRLRKIDGLLSAFARGQVTVCLILGTFYALGLTFLGVPLGLVAGFVIGFFNLIPFMSYIAGLPLALGLGWAGDLSFAQLGWVVAVFTFGQFVEGNFITPKIVGESLGLHSVVIMLAVLIGGTYFGVAGMLLAVPITATLSVFWPDFVRWYKDTEFYGDEPPAEAPPIAE